MHLTSTGKLLAGEVRMAPDPGSRLGRHAPGRLTVFAADTRKQVGELEVGLFPLTITSSPDGRLAYVACAISSTVDVVDLESLDRLARLDIVKLGEAGRARPGVSPAPGLIAVRGGSGRTRRPPRPRTAVAGSPR